MLPNIRFCRFQCVPACDRLLGLDTALGPFNDLEYEAPAASRHLERDPVTVHAGTREVAGNPEATRAEPLSPEHGDAFDNNIIQLRIAP